MAEWSFGGRPHTKIRSPVDYSYSTAVLWIALLAWLVYIQLGYLIALKSAILRKKTSYSSTRAGDYTAQQNQKEEATEKKQVHGGGAQGQQTKI